MEKSINSLMKRLISAGVMLAIMIIFFYVPIIAQQIFVAIIFLICYHEWQKLAFLTDKPLFYLGIGAPYIFLSLGISLYLLTHYFEIFISLIILVIATDCGGFIFGKLIGGKKICPAVSPNKTWAGLAGGVVLAIASGLAINYYQGYLNYPLPVIIAICTFFACVSQAGDFLESALKRAANAKDSGTIIMGHGGMLDRFDGHIMAQIFGFLLTIF